eukprot:3604036-Rhodomonas_salina.5
MCRAYVCMLGAAMTLRKPLVSWRIPPVWPPFKPRRFEDAWHELFREPDQLLCNLLANHHVRAQHPCTAEVSRQTHLPRSFALFSCKAEAVPNRSRRLDNR